MDAFALGLKLADRIMKDGKLSSFIKQRYSSYDSGLGQKIEKGDVGFEELEKYMLEKGDAAPNVSGRQEMLENLVNMYLC